MRVICLLCLILAPLVSSSQFKREWSAGEYNISFGGSSFQSSVVIAHSTALDLLNSAGKVILKKVNTENLLIVDSTSLNSAVQKSRINCSALYNYKDSLIIAVSNSLNSDSSWVSVFDDQLNLLKNIDLSPYGSIASGSILAYDDTLVIGGGVRSLNDRSPAILKINLNDNSVFFKSFPYYDKGFMITVQKIDNLLYCGIAFSRANTDFMKLNRSFDTLFTKDITVDYYGNNYPIRFFSRHDSIFSIVKYPRGLIISNIDSVFNVYSKDTINYAEHNISGYSLNTHNLDSIFYVPFASEDIYVPQIQGKTNPLSTLCFNYKGRLHYQHNFDSTQYYKGIGVLPTATGPISVGYRYTGNTHPDSVKTKLVLLKLDLNGSLVNLSNDELNFEDIIDIFPNPASSNIYIKASIEFSSIQIYNLAGKKTIEHLVNNPKRDSEISINVNLLPKGIYIIQLTKNSTEIARCKFLISR